MGSLAFEPAYEGKGVKHPLTPEAPDFSRGVAHKNNVKVFVKYGNSGWKFFQELKPVHEVNLYNINKIFLLTSCLP